MSNSILFHSLCFAGFDAFGGYFLALFDELWPVPVKAKQIRELGGEALKELYLAASCFIEDVYLCTAAKRGVSACLDGAGVFYADALSNMITGDVDADVYNAAIIIDRAVF